MKLSVPSLWLFGLIATIHNGDFHVGEVIHPDSRHKHKHSRMLGRGRWIKWPVDSLDEGSFSQDLFSTFSLSVRLHYFLMKIFPSLLASASNSPTVRIRIEPCVTPLHMRPNI